MKQLWLFLGWWLVSTTCNSAPPTTIRFPTLGMDVDQRAILLAIDDQSLPLKDNLCYYLSKPSVRPKAVIRPERDDSSAPDELAANFYGTVLQEGDKFRMWYYGVRRESNKWKLIGQLCYAESKDGIDWVKPELGQVELKGSKQNNALALVVGDTQGVTVIKDEQDPDPGHRYKMILQYMPQDVPTLKKAVSADGITWTDAGDIPQHEFREQSSFFKHNGMYIVCGHTVSLGDGGQPRGRQGFAWISPDFQDWPIEQAESFQLPEPPYKDSKQWKWAQHFDQVHLGVGAASFGNVAVGLYGLWHERGWGANGTTCDFGLVVSNDGMHFREPIPGHVYMKSDEVPLPVVPGRKFPTMLCQANGLLNVGDETRIYYGRWRNSEWPLNGDGSNYYAEIGLATLPRDRWGALGLYPKTTSGAVWTAPIALPETECSIRLNAEAASSMRVEVADANFELHPDFSEENSGTVKQQAGLDCEVSWPATKLKQLRGKTVRLRVHLKKDAEEPRLYAIYVSAAPSSF